jgi:phage terminase small subunit
MTGAGTAMLLASQTGFRTLGRHAQGARLLTKADVEQAIKRRKAAHLWRSELSAQRILEELSRGYALAKPGI